MAEFEADYEDDQCEYCGGDPRVENRFVLGKSVLSASGIRFVSDSVSVAYARESIRSVNYVLTNNCTSGGLHWRPSLSIKIDDPEGIYDDGFDVRIVYRNECYANIFGKRIASVVGVRFRTEIK